MEIVWINRRSLKKYYDEAEKQYKGGIIKAAQGQIAAMYYETNRYDRWI